MGFCWIKVKLSKCNEIYQETLTNRKSNLEILLHSFLVIYQQKVKQTKKTKKLTPHKKLNFWSRVFPVNCRLCHIWSRFRGNCKFGHIYWNNSLWKTSFLCGVTFLIAGSPFTLLNINSNVFHITLFSFLPNSASKTLLSWLLTWRNVDEMISQILEWNKWVEGRNVMRSKMWDTLKLETPFRETWFARVSVCQELPFNIFYDEGKPVTGETLFCRNAGLAKEKLENFSETDFT